tara:strand:+ start:61 stop:483 length:423 start_codon:yes stop_codon:yes gene_type:complete
MKAVLDTNVLVSALLSRNGSPNHILRQAGETYQLFISHDILKETNRVLHEPKIQNIAKLTETEINQFLDSITSIATLIENPPILRVIKDDPDDNRILACAVKAKANYLVSGDKHLLSLSAYKEIEIISPGEFRALSHIKS